MTRLRVALRVPVGRPLPDIADFVARCEDAGFDGVGIHDHPSSGRDAYLALALAARADAPILLIHGQDDTVVPISQSESMERALKRAGKPVDFVVMENEDHWLSRGATRTEMLEK